MLKINEKKKLVPSIANKVANKITERLGLAYAK